MQSGSLLFFPLILKRDFYCPCACLSPNFLPVLSVVEFPSNSFCPKCSTDCIIPVSVQLEEKWTWRHECFAWNELFAWTLDLELKTNDMALFTCEHVCSPDIMLVIYISEALTLLLPVTNIPKWDSSIWEQPKWDHFCVKAIRGTYHRNLPFFQTHTRFSNCTKKK